ncbi:MAG: metallophosphoesterase [Rhizobiaceae bacterium]|nr:metallophosphoesterase [Rhizobiaceae bacterium]
MRTAFLSDIHANREAFEAVLDAVERVGVDRIVILGDVVGYGPDPEHAVETAAALVDRGAVCLLGNHDEAVLSGPRGMSENARIAVNWTRGRLERAHLDFLAGLPLTHEEDGALHVHASADEPARWHYVDSCSAAARSLSATSARLIVCGHTHLPAIFYARPGATPTHFRPLDDKPAPLLSVLRHVVVVGSVGQPRDGNPAACFGLLDTQERAFTMMRAPYDAERTARKIEAAGDLPKWLAMRLLVGR